MASVTVRHLDDKDYREMSCIFDEDKRVAFAKEVIKNNNYIRVADLELGGPLGGILNEAYFLTNSVDTSWYKTDREDIIVAEGFEGGCRSTSIGDIIQVAGETYMVASVGFKHIDMES
jgi:hypothetical protein